MSALVVVARAAEGHRAYLPTATRSADGRILVAYREADGHVRDVGRILGVHSDDDGLSWSAPRPLVDTELDDRDPMLTTLSNGDLLLQYFRTDWSRSPWRVAGVQVVRSGDGGATWGEPVDVDSTMVTETTQRWGGYLAGHVATHGRIRELPGGDLLSPVYGVHAGDRYHSAAVVRSTDGGLTWPRENEVTLGRSAGQAYLEPVLTVLPGNRVIALLRTEQQAELTRSDDGGLSWTAPEPIDLWASSADTATLPDGSVLLAYGDASRTSTRARPTTATIVTDPLGRWDAGRRHLIYDAGRDTFDQANPAIVELPGERLLIITYDIFRRELVGVIRTREQLT